MKRAYCLMSIVVLVACELSTKVGELPEDTLNLEVDITDDDAQVSTEDGADTLPPQGTTEDGELPCILEGRPVDCPPPPEDWCTSELDTPLPIGLVQYWNQFCDEPSETSEAETTGGGAMSGPCLIDDELMQCPPPPIDWCDSDRSTPLPEGLVEFWNTFCEEPTESTSETEGG